LDSSKYRIQEKSVINVYLINVPAENNSENNPEPVSTEFIRISISCI